MGGADGERRGFFVVERAEAFPVGARLFQLNVLADHGDHISPVANLAHDLVGYERHVALCTEFLGGFPDESVVIMTGKPRVSNWRAARSLVKNLPHATGWPMVVACDVHPIGKRASGPERGGAPATVCSLEIPARVPSSAAHASSRTTSCSLPMICVR